MRDIDVTGFGVVGIHTENTPPAKIFTPAVSNRHVGAVFITNHAVAPLLGVRAL